MKVMMTRTRRMLITPRGFAPRHASAEASAMSAVALGEGGTPRHARSRGPASPTPLAWAHSPARSPSADTGLKPSRPDFFRRLRHQLELLLLLFGCQSIAFVR